jgi:hypothetical protein
MEFNKYQSSIEELQLDQYPEEVVNEFFEFINSVPFIRNLISADRPLCKDLPRDERGRAIIDITNPPIIEDVDYFRQTAITFQKTKKFTTLRPNANPNSEYGRWTSREIKRIWYGMLRESDGLWIPGDMYFYLNYTPILQSKVREGSKAADRITDFPEWWEGILYRYIYQNLARENAHHCAEIAKRGASKSYVSASQLSRLFFCGDNYDVQEQVRGLVLAYQKEYLTKDGTLNKFAEMRNFISKNTGWPHKCLTKSLDKMYWRMGEIDLNTGAEIGTLNEVLGLSAKDDVDKARGKRATKIIVEEFGNFPKVADTFRVLLPSVQEGDITFGQISLIGTGGSEGNDFAGAQEMLFNPIGYNIEPVVNVYDKSAQGRGNCIYFFPAYLNRKGCYNKDGISDVTKALLELCNNRYIVKYNSSDPMALTRTKAENPITLQEAIMRRDSTIFPVAAINERIEELKADPKIFDDIMVGDLVINSEGKVVYKPTTATPIRHFPHKDNKLEGAIEIYKTPVLDKNGKPMTGRYIAGIDPYDDDSSNTMSLGSMFVLDIFTDEIVAEYTGRPMFADDFYEVCRLIALYYNAKINYENNKKGLYTYFSKMHCLYLLTDILEFLKDRDTPINNIVTNKTKGTNATLPVNNHARRDIRDWLLKPVTVIESGPEGDVEVVKTMISKIRNIALLQELAQWNPDGNFDRVSAMGMLMLLREDILRLSGPEGVNTTEKDDSEDLANDDFFTRNFADTKREEL